MYLHNEHSQQDVQYQSFNPPPFLSTPHVSHVV